METKIWGKSKVNEKEVSLSQHINDVLEVFLHLEKKVSNPQLKKLIKIVIEYHDAGKVLPYFQRKTLKNTDYVPFEVYTNIPHSLLSTLLVDEKVLKIHLNTIFSGDTDKVETYSKYVLSAIAYHHWRENFYDIIEGHTDVFERLVKLVSNTNKWNQIEENLKSVYSDISNGKVKLAINQKWLDGLTNGIRFADYVVPPYLLYRMPKRIEMNATHLKDWVLISGFTMLSDHFASYIEGEAEEGVSSDKVEIDGLDFGQIKEEIDFDLQNKVKGYDPSKIWQFEYADEYKNDNTILLAPTGMGKTEFSFLWTNGEKFFYTLPIRTAVNQIFDRTKKIFGKERAGILHSDADVYILGEGGETESMRIYELARSLSYPAIVSTGDQFFPYALRPPAYEKIFAKFSYSRLIIDEVQAYDPKAAAIVVKFIEHIVQMGGKFLLMTATIPSFIQKEIDRRIGKDFKTLNLFEKDTDLSNFSKHKVQLKVEKYKEEQLSYSKELIQEIISKALENGGSRVLVVMNTVKQAQAVFDDLTNNASDVVEVRLFHSRFTQAHRKTIENELSKFIGNNDVSRVDKRPKILVATQVVEASLDLDADYLYTELAPWDSLIQRMGRVLREAHPKLNNLIQVISRRYGKHIVTTKTTSTTLFDQHDCVGSMPDNIFFIVYSGLDKKGKEVLESGQGYVYHSELLSLTLKLIENLDIDEKGLTEFFEKEKPIKLEGIKASMITLSEKQKSHLVGLLYHALGNSEKKKSRYLSQFYNMLQILDAGFMSDRKSDAQKVFREINDVNVISSHIRDEFIQKLKDFDYKEKYAYTRFKRDILSKHLISVQVRKVKEYLTEVNQVNYSIRLKEEITDAKVLSKLNNWLWGVYFVDFEYSEASGLTGINEVSGFEFL